MFCSADQAINLAVWTAKKGLPRLLSNSIYHTGCLHNCTLYFTKWRKLCEKQRHNDDRPQPKMAAKRDSTEENMNRAIVMQNRQHLEVIHEVCIQSCKQVYICVMTDRETIKDQVQDLLERCCLYFPVSCMTCFMMLRVI